MNKNQLTTKQRQNQAGFTLVELIVVIAIIGILMVIAVANFRGAEGRSNLRNEAESTAGIIRQAKNYAISQKRVEDPDNLGNTIVPDGGYGVHYDLSENNKYIIFANVGSGTSGRYEEGDDIVVEEGEMLPNVYLDKIMYNLASAPEGFIDILFIPPSGTASFIVYTTGTHPAQYENTAELKLRHSENDGEETVTVYEATGAVEIE